MTPVRILTPSLETPVLAEPNYYLLILPDGRTDAMLVTPVPVDSRNWALLIGDCEAIWTALPGPDDAEDVDDPRALRAHMDHLSARYSLPTDVCSAIVSLCVKGKRYGIIELVAKQRHLDVQVVPHKAWSSHDLSDW